MVFVTLPVAQARKLREALMGEGMVVADENPLRLVTHLDIRRDDVQAFVTAVRRLVRA
jgi:threonine aldolase